MTLEEYQKKRDFSLTPEPYMKDEKEVIGPLHFVIQKHKATSLHYDFRIQIGSILKSWSIPKGPSLNPKDKRLAMLIEDYPLSYRTFEGVIPEGNYGAGRMIIWDEGTYHAISTLGRFETEYKIKQGLERGQLFFVLNGQKLKGEFSLIKMRTNGVKSWLLIKKSDSFSVINPYQGDDRSVVSQKTLDQLEEDTSHNLPSLPIKRNEIKKTLEKKVLESTLEKAQPFTIANQDKVFWPSKGYTKGDMMYYYDQISSYILPYVRYRPLTLLRHPDGIHGNSFYQIDVDHFPPDWVTTIPMYSEIKKKNIHFILCQNNATLLYLANIGCIEIHPWHSHIPTFRKPDYAIINMQPIGTRFDKVIEAARTTFEILNFLEVESYCKTSGKNGLHIQIPLGAKYTYDQVYSFSEIIITLIHNKLITSTSIKSSNVKNHTVFLDISLNRPAYTLISPYSLRAVPHATVSTPLRWQEVNSKLDPKNFTITTILKRLEKEGDLAKHILGKGIDLEYVIGRLEDLYMKRDRKTNTIRMLNFTNFSQRLTRSLVEHL